MFPPRGAPRVIWLGSAGEMTPLQHLAARVHDRVDAIVGAGESKPFRPHVTLARVKDPGRRVDWAGALGAITVVRTITHVDSVTLYESHTGPRGSTYTVRMRTPLTAPAAPRGTG